MVIGVRPRKNSASIADFKKAKTEPIPSYELINMARSTTVSLEVFFRCYVLQGDRRVSPFCALIL
jgi:hypothetical protein